MKDGFYQDCSGLLMVRTAKDEYMAHMLCFIPKMQGNVEAEGRVYSNEIELKHD